MREGALGENQGIPLTVPAVSVRSQQRRGVMVNNTVKMTVAALLVLFVSAGTALAADEVLARIGKRVVTEKDIEYLIALYPENEQALLKGSAEYREVLLKNMVTVIVVSDIAKKKSFDKKGDIGKQVEMIVNEYLARAYVEQEILGGVTVSDEEVEKFYRDNQSAFENPEQLRVRHILISVKPGASDEEKNAAKKKRRTSWNGSKGRRFGPNSPKNTPKTRVQGRRAATWATSQGTPRCRNLNRPPLLWKSGE